MRGTQSLPPVVTVNNVRPDINGNAIIDIPVTSVDGKTGAVTTNAYTPDNPPPYPVTKVNNKTGAVTLTASDVDAMPSDKISFSLSGTTLTITVR